MSQRNYIWMLGWKLLLLPASADACSMCVTASADKILPPVETWALWLTILFLLISLIGSITGERLSGIPSFLRAFIVVSVLLLAGAGFLGIWFMVVLALPLMIFCTGVLRTHLRSQERRFHVLKVSLAFVVIAVFIGLGGLTAHVHLTRTPAEYAIKWAHTAPGRLTMEALKGEGRSALPQFRRIAAEIEPRRSGVASDVIARYGDPERDVPLLIDVLRRDGGESLASRDIEAALTRLTGLTLPPGSNYVQWSNAWKKSGNPFKLEESLPDTRSPGPVGLK